MSKILLYGGSFNPIHKGHIYIARKVKKALRADEVWFIPTFKPALKEDFKVSYVDRVKMLKLALKNERKMKISLVESQLEGINYTVNTLRYLKEKYQDHDFYFLMGSDQYLNIEKWHEYQKLFDLAKIVVVNRDNDIITDKYKIKKIYLKKHLAQSSKIRQGNFNYLAPAVIRYIAENGLYYEEILRSFISEKRYDHSLRVVKCGLEIASNYKICQKEVYLATLLHDLAKESLELPLLMEYHFNDKINLPKALWHAYGGFVLAKRLGIRNKNILNAIKNHVEGNNCKTILDKIVFCSDKLEEGRGYDSRPLIELCKQDINEGFKKVKENNDKYVKEQIKMRNQSH